MTECLASKKLGVTIPRAGMPLSRLPEFVCRVEDLGYESVWSEEATGTDGFVPLAVAAANSTRLRLVTGVINPYTRGWAVLAQTAAALSLVSNGRFTLGIGSSSKVIVTDYNQREFLEPIDTLRQCINYLHRVCAGERVDGGFRLQQPPESTIPIVVAALRGRTLDLAAEVASGAFGNFIPISKAARVREQFPREKQFACRVFSFGGDGVSTEEAMAGACRLFTAYGSSPFYRRFFESLGYAEDVGPMADAWSAGDRRRALELVPEDLVREIFLLGPPEAQRERIEQLWAAGIDVPVLAMYGQTVASDRRLEEFALAL